MRNKRKIAGVLLIVAIFVGWIIYVVIASQTTPYDGDSQIQTVETIVILREDIVSVGADSVYYITTETGKEFRTSEDVFYRLGRGRHTVITTKRDGEDFILDIVK